MQKRRFSDPYEDPIVSDKEFPPDYLDISINSSGSRLYGVLYIAQGPGPHPTIILLHGFPGTERNLDMAHGFRRAGFNTLVFHYRGSWGSEGSFSFGNVLEDVKAALQYVKSEEVIKHCRIDENCIIVAGHSMGGFAALNTAAADNSIRACVAMAPFDFGTMGGLAREDEKTLTFLQEMFRDCIVPLKGTSVEALINEAMENSKHWSFVNLAPLLAPQRLLLVAASEDKLAVPDLHYYPLQHKLLFSNSGVFKSHLLESDHSFQSKRVFLTRLVIDWLEKIL